MASTINASTSSGIVTTADNSGQLELQTASATRLTINSSGNVGIGTTSPTTSLTINRNTSFTGTPTTPIPGLHLIAADSANIGTSYDGFGANAQITFRRSNGTLSSPSALLSGNPLGAITWRGYGATAYSSGNRGLIQLVAAENWTDTAQGTYLVFNTVASGTTTSAEKMRIDSSGNVGIGTTNPNFASLTTMVSVNGATTSGFGTKVADAGALYISSGSTYSTITELRSQPLVFGTNNTERMRITSTGNVGIGITSPVANLEIDGGASVTAFALATNCNGTLPSATPIGLVISQNYALGNAEVDFFYNSSSYLGDNGGFRFYQRTGASTVNEMLRLTQNALYMFTGGTERMRIDSSGNVGIGNTPSGTYKLQVSGLISDSKGDVRAAPIQSKTSAYVLTATDAGQTISITTGGVTVNASVFSAGDMVSIFNNSGASQTITQGASVTLRLSGTATTGSRTLAQYGVATLLCVVGGATPTFACTGAGLT